MTKKMKIFTWTSVGVLSAGVVAGVSVTLYMVFKNDNKDLGNPEYYKGKDEGKAKFNLKWYSNSRGEEFLSNQGYEDLDAYLDKYLYYGPESVALKEIVFGDRNVMSDTSSGVYFGATRQMFINIENYVDAINLTEMEKIKSVSEVIAHEYGHHFAHMYLKNNKESDPNTEVTYDADNQKTIWNADYINKWKELSGFSGPISSQKNIKMSSSINSVEFTNINSVASLAQLYEMSNSKDHKSVLDDKGNYYWGNKLTPQDKSFPKFDNSESLKYYYSADEQFVRLTEMLMWPKEYFKNGKFDDDSSFFIPQDNIAGVNSLWSPQAFDLAHSLQLSKLTKLNIDDPLIYPNYPFGGKLFGKLEPEFKVTDNSTDYYNFLVKSMGYQSQMSRIYTKNSGEIIKNKYSEKLELKGDNPDDLNEIKLSGYTEKAWKYIAIVDNTNQEIVKNISITSNTYSNGSQSSLFHYFGRKRMDVQFGKNSDIYDWTNKWNKPQDTKYAYIMNDFVNAKTFQGSNYSLFFNDDANISYVDAIKNDGSISKTLNTIDNDDGTEILTSYEEYFPEDQKYWKFDFKTNQLIVSKDY